jgi:hypothetical protein
VEPSIIRRVPGDGVLDHPRLCACGTDPQPKAGQIAVEKHLVGDAWWQHDGANDLCGQSHFRQLH